MKKNYFLTLVAALLMAVTTSAADNFAGVYKLNALTADQSEALGSISADAAFRIMPGDAEADYYLCSVAGYGCKFPMTYDEAAGTLTAEDPSMYGQAFGIMVLYFSDMEQVVVTSPSMVFNVKDDGILELAEEAILGPIMGEEILGVYAPGIILTKDATPSVPVADVIGNYTFTGQNTDPITQEITEVEYTMSVAQAEGNILTINGFMGIDGIQATYIPEVGLIQIVAQEVGAMSVAQNNGDIFFTVAAGELELVTPAMAAEEAMPPSVSLINGKAVKKSGDVVIPSEGFGGIYQLTDLTADQSEALGSISADASFRIMPGDAEADYYLCSVAGYGCKFPMTYDEAAGTLTAEDPSLYGQAFGIMLVYFGDMDQVAVDGSSIVFNVKDDGTLELAEEVILGPMYGDEIFGVYAPGIILTKDATPSVSAADVAGSYAFAGQHIDPFTYEISDVEYTMSIAQAEGNALTINGFMGVDGIQATYIPEVGMIEIAQQEINTVTVYQNNGSIFLMLSDGDLELVTTAMVIEEEAIAPSVSLINGKAVKKSGDDAVEKVAAAQAVGVSVVNGAIYVNSAEPVAVQVYNASGVRVYSDAAVSGPITLPRGIYFVKVAGNAKAVAVAL